MPMAINKDLPDLAPLIHLAALDPHLSTESLYRVCDAARHLNFSGLCTSPNRIKLARERLGAKVKTKVIAVISFPFGFIPSEQKQKEAEWCAEYGADELDVVPDFFALEERRLEDFASELGKICELGLPTRAIIDKSRLQPEKLSIATESAIDAGVIEIQTGNGFGPSCTPTYVRELKELARGRCGIKAVGGIKKLDHALELVEAGASTLGTSFGIQIAQEIKKGNKNK